MASVPENPVPTPAPSADRLWAEQLAMGMALLVGILIFLALFHARMLSTGVAILGPNDLDAYGWASVLGIFLQVVVHELGTIVVAWRLKLPLSFRFFGFGANCTAILEYRPRNVWIDAVVGFAGPVTGTVASLALHGAYEMTKGQDPSTQAAIAPLFLGMACVGYFYNLITLIPILDLEGGWIAPAIAPQGLAAGVVWLGVLSGGPVQPRFALRGGLCHPPVYSAPARARAADRHGLHDPATGDRRRALFLFGDRLGHDQQQDIRGHARISAGGDGGLIRRKRTQRRDRVICNSSFQSPSS